MKTKNSLKLLTVCMCLISCHSYGQKITRPDIQYVSLQDTFLVNVLDSMITYLEETDTLFSQGYGYFMVHLSRPMAYGAKLDDNTRIDTVFQYHIQVNYMHPDQDVNFFDNLYPHYYSLVGGRVVNLSNHYIVGRQLGFSEGSKRIYEEVLEKNLAPAGHPSHRLYMIGEATVIYYLQNRFTGTYEKPVVVYEKY